ncbi:unnamed protein product [Cuscuta epithymum]|uniref:Uncharacterized protein n=1 Tax=Cuscuta epithymum TaxID=186058 RepID=A0AAV0D7B1_9ASTE|nr:unnamed protein product [Cuscuta epithymum]
MVCFLSCLGITNKHKRRKSSKKIQPTFNKVAGKYTPLDCRIPDEPHSQTRNTRKDSQALKVKKKVSFNLNVQIYEPLRQESINYDFSSDGLEKLDSEYPSDYRYYSCRDSFDDDVDDDIRLDESDLEEEEIDEEEDGFGNENELILGQGDNGRTRSSEYLDCVLKPVENLTQWKAVKGISLKKNQKENIRGRDEEGEKPSIPNPVSDPLKCKQHQNKRIPLQVDASLSNWLISAENKPLCA